MNNVYRITDALILCADKDLHGITFVGEGKTKYFSYRQLLQQSLLLLGTMQQSGVRPGDEVIIQLEDNQQLLCAFWACLLGGFVAVPLSVGIQTEQKLKIFHVWSTLRHPYWICDPVHVARVESAAAATPFEELFTTILSRLFVIDDMYQPRETGILSPGAAEDLAYIQFSSGSTGDPKGVMLTHNNLLTNIRDIIQSLCITTTDKLFSWMPLTHDMGLIGFHLTGIVASISTVSMVTNRFIRRPLAWMDLVAQHKATVLYSPNFGLQYFLGALVPGYQYTWDLSAVRLLVNGAEAISAPLCQRFQEQLQPYGLPQHIIACAYGLAEAAVEVAVTPPGAPVRVHYLHRDFLNTGMTVRYVNEDDPGAVSFADVGYPVSGCKVRICDDADGLLKENHIGHIQIKGSNVTAGYYNNPAATNHVYTSDSWLRTGDLGFMQDGRLVVTGRHKNIIILNGQNYYPQDIERIIERAGISETGKMAVCSDVGEHGEERLLVFILHKGSEHTFTEISNQVISIISRQLGISVYAVLPVRKIPKTTSGKIQYYKLKELFLQTVVPEPVRETISIQETILQILSALLPDRTITVHTRLPELELSSLLITRMSGRIASRVGVQVPVGFLFRDISVSDLALNISALQETAEQPVSIGAIPPLSVAQQRILEECKMNPGSSAYHLPVCFTMKGTVDIGLLNAAIELLVEQHLVLDKRVRLEYREATDREAVVRQLINAPFQEGQPRWRICLVQEGPESYLLVFVIHHILADGWTVLQLFRELFSYYETMAKGNITPAPVTNTSTFDRYLLWETRFHLSAEYKRQQAYWQQRLANMPALGAFSGKSRSKDGHATILHYNYALSASLFRQVKDFARLRHTTPFTVFAALLQFLRYRYTGTADQVLGFEVRTRRSPDLENGMGYMLNTLPLRSSITGGETFEELLTQIRNATFEAYDHQEYPFEHMLADTGSTLFDMMVIYQDFLQEQQLPVIEGVKTEHIRVYPDHGYTDMLIELTDLGAGLDINILYNPELYTTPLVERMMGHLILLMQQVLTGTVQPLNAYRLLTDNELQLLTTLQPAETVKPLAAITVPASITLCAAAAPERMALDGISYQSLQSRALRFAAYLHRDVGIQKGDRVGFITGRDQQMVIAMLGIWYAGGCFVPVDPGQPADRCLQLMTESEMACIVVDDVGLLLLENKALPCRSVHVSQTADPGNVLLPAISTEDLAYIMYTSGSTGRPKGVMITHATLAEYISHFTGYFHITGDDRFIQQASVAFDTMIEEIFPALCCGAEVIIAPHGGRDITALSELLETRKITVLSATPHVIRELNHIGWKKNAALRIVISGGDVLLPADISDIPDKIAVYNTYGPVEATVCACYYPVTNVAEASLIGRPIAGRQLYILDDHQQILPVGIAGEICIAGGLAAGYLNAPDETAAKFITAPFDNHLRIYRTGDRGLVTEAGYFAFSGRKDRQVKIRGHRVEPGDIEQAISEAPGVKAVVVCWDEATQRLIAFVTATPDITATLLRAYLVSKLPLYMLPHRFEVLQQLPLTASGKPDRQLLQKNCRMIPVQAAIPENELEVMLLELVQTVLHIENIGVTGNLFEYGCDSIRAVRIANGIKTQLGYEANLRDLFLYPSVRELAVYLQSGTAKTSVQLFKAPALSHYPLSFAQQQIWLHEQIQGASCIYNEGVVFSVSGSPSAAAIEKAFQQVVNRHGQLRARFIEIDGEPRQVIDVPDSKAVVVETLNGNFSKEQVMDLFRQEFQQPFHLEDGYLFRLLLVENGDHEFYLGVVIHHIITDDWSNDLLIKEFQSYYKQEEISLEEPFYDYTDYAISVTDNADAEMFWSRYLEDAPPVLSLPLDYNRPVIKQAAAERVFTTLDTTTIQQVCREHQVTPFMLMAATLGILLGKYTDTYDIVIGTPVAGREQPALAEMIGCFVAMIPLRIQFNPDDSLIVILRKVRNRCLQVYGQAVSGLPEVLANRGRNQDLSRAPHFDVIISMQGTGKEISSFSMQGDHFQFMDKPVIGSKYDLSVFVHDSIITLEYAPHLFSRERICRMAAHFKNIIDCFSGSISTPVKELEYMSHAEKQALIGRFEHLDVPFNRSATVFEQVEQQALLHPDKIAVRDENNTYTYAEVIRYAENIAAYLQHHQLIRPDVPVGLMLSRSGMMVITILGIWKSGGCYLPIEDSLPQERITFMLQDAGSDLLLSDKLPLFDTNVTVLLIDDILHQGGKLLPQSAKQGELAYVMYTSGSTGQPKGVAVKEISVLNVLAAMGNKLQVGQGDSMLAISSYAFDISVVELFLALLHGASLFVAAKERIVDVVSLKQLIETIVPTCMQATPSLWQSLIATGWMGHHLLKAVTCGEALSQRIREDLLERTGQLWNLYGPTETTIFSTGAIITPGTPPDSIGLPFPSTVIYLADENRRLVPEGMYGEILIGGEGLAAGYLHRPELTGTRFIDDPFHIGKRLYATGDKGRWLSNGELEYAGRIDEQVKIRGYRIEPGEIENVLLQFEGITAAAVVITAGEAEDKQLLAYIVLQPAIEIMEIQLKEYLHQFLPAYMVPGRIMRLPHLPVTHNGKTDRRRLATMKGIALPAAPHIPGKPANGIEEQLMSMWKELLGRDDFGTSDNFFLLGGHSLKANQLVGRIHRATGVKIALSDIFFHPTISQIGRMIREADQNAFQYIEL